MTDRASTPSLPEGTPGEPSVLTAIGQSGADVARASLNRLLASSEARLDVARAALADPKNRAKGLDKLITEDANRTLSELLASSLAQLDEAIRHFDASQATSPSAIESVLPYDEVLARLLERIGEIGANVARSLREKSARRLQRQREGEINENELWGTWFPEPRFARGIASAIWHDRVVPSLIKPASLVMAVAEPLAHLSARTCVIRRSEDGMCISLNMPDGACANVLQPAAVSTGALDALTVDRGLKLFGSLAYHRILRWLIFTAHDQALARNPDPRVIRSPGGWTKLAHKLNMAGNNKAQTQLRDIVEAMHATELPLPPTTQTSRMLIRTVIPAVGRRAGLITLVVGTALLPDYVHDLQEIAGSSRPGRRASRLVPVLGVPPLVGRQRDHGAQATLSMLVVAYLRDHAFELIECNGVLLDPPRMNDLADQAGVGRGCVAAIFERWTRDGPDGPAFLARRGGDRYTLGDAHVKERRFLEEGGRRELDGARAGKNGARRRNAKFRSPSGSHR